MRCVRLMRQGYGNGNVALHDVRQPPEQSLVQHFDQHTSWVCAYVSHLMAQVVNVHINPDGAHCLISGSRSGDILWWDQRFPGQPVRSIMVSHRTSCNHQAYQFKKEDVMSDFVVHDHLSLMATSAHGTGHFIKVRLVCNGKCLHACVFCQT